MQTIPLSMIPTGCCVTIHSIVPTHAKDMIAKRLYDLGFDSAEKITVIGRTWFKAGPIAIKIGRTRFALRKSEANRILVTQNTI